MGEIPVPFHDAVRHALDALVAGELPDLLTWVRDHGDHGAVLVPQPDAIWTHPLTDFDGRPDGTHFGVVPLWTQAESPSDLSAEFEVDDGGRVRLTDVHML